MPTITTFPPPESGAFGGTIVNESGIPIRVAKLQAAPPSLVEVPPYKETWDKDGELSGLTRTFLCDWKDRVAARDYFLGYGNVIPNPAAGGGGGSTLITGGFASITSTAPPVAGGLLTRTVPAQDPEFPWFWCERAEVVGQGVWIQNPDVVATDGQGKVVLDANGKPTAALKIAFMGSDTGTGKDCAVITTSWAMRPYEVRTDAEVAALPNTQGELERWVERDRTYSLTTIPLPADSLLTFAEGPFAGKKVDANALFVSLPQSALVWVWHDVPDVPEANIAATVGRTNSDTFDGARGYPSWPPGTLLMLPPERKKHRTTRGRYKFTITYRALHRPETWARFPAADAHFYLATTDGTPTGASLYQTAPFAACFQPPAPNQYE